MKTKKTFAVRIELEGNNGFFGIDIILKKSNLYFSDMIIEKRNEILQIIPLLKKIKELKVNMCTITFETYDNFYKSDIREQTRFITGYSGNKIANFNGYNFDFDKVEETQTTIYEFIKSKSDHFNNVAFYEYMKYISDIER